MRTVSVFSDAPPDEPPRPPREEPRTGAGEVSGSSFGRKIEPPVSRRYWVGSALPPPRDERAGSEPEPAEETVPSGTTTGRKGATRQEVASPGRGEASWQMAR